MSLDKFQATDAWRNKLKKHLFAERKTTSSQNKITITTSQLPPRLSYQLSDDLQSILEEKKKIPRVDRNMPRVRVRDEADDKENIEECHEGRHSSNAIKLKCQLNGENTRLVDDNALNMTNTSFETLERMCEKTASDPNSTLFRYLDQDSTVSLKATRVNTNIVRLPSFDEEADALERLLDELSVEEAERRMKGLATLTDVTQLDDIEAPSRFWENTMNAETLQSISPVKMVGLMRQSTIMEELSDVSESETSSTSYQSAMKTCTSNETTGCYETANETAACSDRGIKTKLSTNSSEKSLSTELFQQINFRQKFFNDDKKEEPEEEHLEESIQLIDLCFEKEVDPLSEPLQLIDLDATVKCLPENEEKAQDHLSEKTELEDEESSLESLKCSPESSAQLVNSFESNIVIELSDEDDVNIEGEDNSMSTKEKSPNRSFTITPKESLINEEVEKSLHFNDTMEEVEYMMNKGMQYMQTAKLNGEQLQKQHPLPGANPKNSLTPVKNYERYRSPSPMLLSSGSPKTVIAKPKPVNKHVLNIKPFPKLDLFKKPAVSNLKPTNKFTNSAKKQQYAHVVSPIGAYIKKTPKTPLMSSVRSELNPMPVPKSLKKLNCESISSPGFVSPGQDQQSLQNQVRSLPKKAYISSELKHIVDERTKYTIPGGPKIQRYLVPAMIPAVVRHEGKVKIPENLRTSDMHPAATRKTDDSLADLSMISGDVSVYTIKDAQKF